MDNLALNNETDSQAEVSEISPRKDETPSEGPVSLGEVGQEAGPSFEIHPPKKKRKRGGKRPGAGRPKKSKVKSVFTPKGEEEKKAQEPEVQIGSFADMNHVAAVATAAVDGVVVGVARMRYGAEADILHANKKALADIQAAMLVYLEHTAIQVTPLQGVLIAVAAVYGPPAMALEIGKRQGSKKRAAAPPPPPPPKKENEA